MCGIVPIMPSHKGAWQPDIAKRNDLHADVSSYRELLAFIDVTEQTLKGKWAVFMFYPADFTFVCPTELEDLANRYEERFAQR
jgi:alkyl hydroperoxide reductase subunit AhpC